MRKGPKLSPRFPRPCTAPPWHQVGRRLGALWCLRAAPYRAGPVLLRGDIPAVTRRRRLQQAESDHPRRHFANAIMRKFHARLCTTAEFTLALLPPPPLPRASL